MTFKSVRSLSPWQSALGRTVQKAGLELIITALSRPNRSDGLLTCFKDKTSCLSCNIRPVALDQRTQTSSELQKQLYLHEKYYPCSFQTIYAQFDAAG